MVNLPRVLTIDPPMSKDLDDAVAAVPLPDGGWSIDVCIADVTVGILPDSESDMKARDKAFSTYRGGSMKNPMLSLEHTMRMSLLPNQPRNMAWVQMTLDAGLNVQDVKLQRIQTITQGRLSYAEADKAIQDVAAPFHDEVVSLWKLAQTLFARRQATCNAVWDTERGVLTTEAGTLRQLSAMERHQSHLIIQELMVLTNTTLAQKAAREDIMLLFRNHKPRESASGLRERIKHDLDAAFQGDAQMLKAYLGQLSANIGPAELGVMPIGHWGLNLPAYAWFTSPLRRYADLVNLRAMFGEPVPEQLATLADELTRKEREEKQGISALYRSRDMRPVINLVVSGNTTTLRTVPFRKVLQACRAVDFAPLDLSAELLNRVQSNALESKDLLYLFTDGRDQLSNDDIAVVVNFMVNKPAHILQLATHLVQKHIIPGVQTTKGMGKDQSARALWEQMVVALELTDVPVTIPNIPVPKGKATMQTATSPHENPRMAVNELAQARGATLDFKPPARSGPDHALQFTVMVSWVCGSESLEHSGSGSSKKAAEAQASAALLSELLGTTVTVPQSSQSASSNTPETSTSDVPSGNPKGQLLERATKEGAKVVFGVPQRQGPDHAPEFKTQATWTLGDEVFTGEGASSSKKTAERIAAADLLSKLPAVAEQPATALAPAQTANHKGRLLERAQNTGAEVVFSAPRRSGPDHSPMFKVTATHTLDGVPTEAEGMGSSKKSAEQDAAQQVLAQLN